MKNDKTNEYNLAKFAIVIFFWLLFFALLIVSCSNTNDEDPVIEPPVEEPIVQDVYTNGSMSKIIDNGDENNRVNIVFIGDGFAQADQVKWTNHVNQMTQEMFSSDMGQPFGRYKKFFNTYRIDMISEHSGIDLENRNTPLRGDDECVDFRERDCHGDWDLIHDAIDHYMGNIPMAMREVAINNGSHFGAIHHPPHGNINIYAAFNQRTKNIYLHENGHMLGKLADEYVNNDKKELFYTGGEPNEVNVTSTLNPLKWSRWQGFAQPYLENTVIATYEGARYHGKGIYRPSTNCMMNRYEWTYCAVCREKIIQEIYKIVDPIDSWEIANSVLTVNVIDSEIFDFEWYVDEQKITHDSGALDLKTLSLSAGSHTVKAVVSDNILEHSNSKDEFDWIRSESELLIQEISTQFEI